MRLVPIVACIALVAPAETLAEAPAGSPQSVVEHLQSALLDSMHQAARRTPSERSAALGAVVSDSYDLEFMARTALGAGWRNLEDSQRQRWVEALGRMISATLVDGFGSYTGEAFEILGEHAAPLDTVIVATRLVTPHEDDVEFDYRLRRSGERWRVVDVYVDGGASEVALRRSEYSSVLARSGFEGLIGEVGRKTETLLAHAR
jgi:phospholipid transport system substrate-binding protein